MSKLSIKHKKPNDGQLNSDPSFQKSALDNINIQRIQRGLVPLNLGVQISLNIGCNAKCIMCDGRRYDPASDFNYASVLNLVRKLKHKNISFLMPLGGEPLLDQKGFLDILKESHKNKTRVLLYTNGYFLTQDIIDKLIKNGLDEIGISLHALGEKHDKIMGLKGLFGKIEKNLIYMKDKYPTFKVLIETVIMKENYKNILSLANFIEEHDVHQWTLKKLENFNKNYRRLFIKDEDVLKLFFLLKKSKPNINMRLLAGVCGKETADKKCGYLLHKINIKSDGKIVPCNKVDKNPFYLSRPIEELYHDIKFRDYILDKIDSCNHCLIKK